MDGGNGQETIAQRVIRISDLINVWGGWKSAWPAHGLNPKGGCAVGKVQSASRLHQHGHRQCLN